MNVAPRVPVPAAVTASLLLALLALWPLDLAVAAGPAAEPPAFAFPDTEPGRRVRDYFAAYNADETAMRRYLEANVSKPDLARRSIEDRLDVWFEMRGEHGRLTPDRLVVAGADAVEVEAATEQGFRLAMRFLFDPDPPHTLRGIGVEDIGGTGGGEPPPAPAGPPPTDDAIVATLAAEVDSLAAAGAFSGVVLLDRGGATLLARATGLASREDVRPHTLDTRFNLGSINKIFTHVAILQLARDGRLGLDDPVSRWLDDYPPAAATAMTVRMLLDHRGGVPDMFRSPRLEAPGALGRLRTNGDWYALVRDLPLEFEPGTRQEYSNGGYVLLGEIVTRAAGRDYFDVVRERIYAPAGMTHSGHLAKDDAAADRARPYTRRARRESVDGRTRRSFALEDATPGQGARGSAAGGGYATAGDLVRFARALRAGTLVNGPEASRFVGPGTSLGIAGGSPGVNALLLSEGPYTLVVLANVDPPAAERFARRVGPMLRHAASAGGTARGR